MVVNTEKYLYLVECGLCRFFFYISPCKNIINQKHKIMAFTHTNARGTLYNLNCKDVTLKSTGRVQRIYYFSKDARSTACDKPDGYNVKENSRTGLPFLTKK